MKNFQFVPFDWADLWSCWLQRGLDITSENLSQSIRVAADTLILSL